MRRTQAICLAAALAAPLLAACESAPRARAVKMGPVDTGGDSVEAARRQLKGTWELTTLELIAPDGARTPVEATGRLQYDDFGNLSMRGNVTGSQHIDPSVLNLTGQVAIDPAAHTLRFRGIKAETADDRLIDPKLDAAHVRYYEFTGDLLITTVKDAAGAPTAVATWKRVD
jgi:hypothetical protein